MGHRDQKFRIENVFGSGLEVFDRHRVHVVYIDSIMDVETLYAEVASKIPGDNQMTHLAPLR